MDARRGHGFGWTTPCPADGREVSLRHVEGLWAAYFPAASDYVVTRRELADGLRLAASRGDFHAEVEVAGGRRRGALQLRLSGSAGSQRIVRTERSATAAVERLRLAGALLGALFVMATASNLLTTPPRFTIDMLFVLGGLLLVVMLVVLVMTGAGLGGWLGEQVAAGRWAATLHALDHDDALRADLHRWRALVRSLAHHRDALAGGMRGLPFRCDLGPDDEAAEPTTGALEPPPIEAPVLPFVASSRSSAPT